MTPSPPSVPAGRSPKRRPRRCSRTPSWARARSSRKSMKIAGEICIYTNDNVTYEELG